jgi:hypothetical protein
MVTITALTFATVIAVTVVILCVGEVTEFEEMSGGSPALVAADATLTIGIRDSAGMLLEQP